MTRGSLIAAALSWLLLVGVLIAYVTGDGVTPIEKQTQKLERQAAEMEREGARTYCIGQARATGQPVPGICQPTTTPGQEQ